MQRGIDAFNRRDVEAFRALCAPDVEIVPLRAALEGTVYRGPDAVTRFFTDVDESWDRLRLEAEEMRADDDWVLALGSVHARGASSGAPIELSMGWVTHVRDGMIASLRTYADRADALAAVGLEE